MENKDPKGKSSGEQVGCGELMENKSCFMYKIMKFTRRTDINNAKVQ